MSRTLFMTMFKSNQKSIFGYAIGTVFYMWMVIWIYPSLAKSNGMNELLQSLPSNMLRVFSLQHGIQKLSDYLAAEFYGLLFLIIMSIYSVTTATQLVARLIDRGSMAYVLSTPTSRVRTAFTQALLLVSGLMMISIFATAGGIVGTHLISSDAKLDAGLFIRMNLVGFLLFFVISGYCFLFSCIFNDEKRALGISAVLTTVFFAVHLIGKMSSNVDWMLNYTVFSAFDPQKISSGNADLFWPIFGLSGAGIVLYVMSIVIFKKKDLPL
ncbi:MAG TPA: ABC transporter permease [Bacillales bacterium]|nr:ABC transporter permease [Bacillales bacterium]